MNFPDGLPARAMAAVIVLALLCADSSAQQPVTVPDAAQAGPGQTQSPEPLPESPSSLAPPGKSNDPPLPSGQAAPAEILRSRPPVGTAVAEPIVATGVAASKPAGVAIAPAKQRRLRFILISVGLLAGAGVALGTVAAMSQGSPSKPPGSR